MPDHSPPDNHDPVPDGITCLRCGYDLRTLSSTADCPECGTPIKRSLSRGLLVHSDPKWLRQVTGGLAMLVAAMLIVPFGIWIHAYTAQHTLPPWIDAAATALFLFFSGGGFLYATAREPDRLPPEPNFSARICARWFLMTVPAAAVVYCLGILIFNATAFTVDKHVLESAGIVALAGTLFLAFHATDLARRMPAPRLVHITWIVVLAFEAAGWLALIAAMDWPGRIATGLFGMTTTQANDLWLPIYTTLAPFLPIAVKLSLAALAGLLVVYCFAMLRITREAQHANAKAA